MKLLPKLITFDFGDTLVTSDPPYLARIWLGLKGLGLNRTREEVERAYHQADFKVSKSLIKQADYAPAKYQTGLGEGLLEQLGVKKDREKLLRELTRFLIGFRPERVMVPGAEFLLRELKKRGYVMGIISNNDGRTREKCQAVGIADYFEFILDSTLEGICKPDPNFFQKALKLAGVKSKEALHIGDLWGSDILGATNAGLWAIWIENSYLKTKNLNKVFKVKTIKEVLKYLD